MSGTTPTSTSTLVTAAPQSSETSSTTAAPASGVDLPTHKAKRASQPQNELFYVGHYGKKYSVSRKLYHDLGRDFFDRLNSEDTVKAPETFIDIDNEDAKVFEEFLEFLSSHKGRASTFSIDKLIDLYTFAVKAECNGLKNYTMDLLQDSLGKKPKKSLNPNQIKHIFQNTSNTSDAPLRKFCGAILSLDVLCGRQNPEKLAKKLRYVPEALVEFVKFQRGDLYKLSYDPRRRYAFDSEHDRICTFHVHKDAGYECPSISNSCPRHIDWSSEQEELFVSNACCDDWSEGPDLE